MFRNCPDCDLTSNLCSRIEVVGMIDAQGNDLQGALATSLLSKIEDGHGSALLQIIEHGTSLPLRRTAAGSRVVE